MNRESSSVSRGDLAQLHTLVVETVLVCGCLDGLSKAGIDGLSKAGLDGLSKAGLDGLSKAGLDGRS